MSPANDTADTDNTAHATVADWLDDCLDAAPVVPTGELDQLRIQLEEAAAAALEVLGGVATGPIRLPKGLLANLARCERLARSADSPSSIGGPAMMRGTALDHFIVHRLRSGPVTAPVDELASMLDVEADRERLDELAAMDPVAAAELLTPLAGAAEFFADVDPGWWPRSQSPASVVLADGHVVCSGRIDLEFGGPLTDRPALAIEVKSGSFRGEHAAEAHLYALLMSMRDGVAPVAVGLWYPGTSVLGFPVSIGVLRSVTARLSDGIHRWAELMAGRAPAENPGAWCRWCPEADVCPSVSPALTADRRSGRSAASVDELDGSDLPEHDPDEDPDEDPDAELGR